MIPVAYRWTGPDGQVEIDFDAHCSTAAAALGWRRERLYDRAELDAATETLRLELRGCAQQMATIANALMAHAENIDKALNAHD